MSAGKADEAQAPLDTLGVGTFACTLLQERFWARQKVAAGAGLNIAMRWLVKGSLSQTAVEGALQLLLQRHEILRTTFREIDGRLAQEVHPSCPVKLNAIDLTALPAEERDQLMQLLKLRVAPIPRDLNDLILAEFAAAGAAPPAP